MLRAVKGFEGLYSVDDYGNIYSLLKNRSRRKRILKQYSNEKGYMKVNLYDETGKCKKKYVHRVVAEAFLSNPKSKPNVNHLDCNVKNNTLANLEWCTQSENINYQVLQGHHNRARKVCVNGKNYKSERAASMDLYGNYWKFSHDQRKGGDLHDKTVQTSS